MERAKKEGILKAACGAFARFGFKKTSVDQIARDAGVAKGTVYLAAETKEDLFYQAVHREVRQYTAELAKLIDPRKSADQLLAETTIAGLKYLEERPLVRDLIFGNHQLILPEWADRLDELRTLGRTNIIEILRLGVRQGIFRGELDVEGVAEILEDVAIATHVFHARGDDKQARLQKRMQVAFDLLMNGVRAPVAMAAKASTTKPETLA
ncbi:MAG TPA: TetR family transcriptional regulator [Polyangia bacterium]|nr:TetR family transcriptional regulator [Polyangia bacterium]